MPLTPLLAPGVPHIPELAHKHDPEAALQAWLAHTGPMLLDLHGLLVGVDTAVPPALALQVVEGTHAQHEVALVRKHIQPGGHALCVGVRLGVTAVALAKQTGTRTFCLDEDPAAEASLTLTAVLNGVDVQYIAGDPVPQLHGLAARVGATTVRLAGDAALLARLTGVAVLPATVQGVVLAPSLPSQGEGEVYALALRNLLRQGFEPWDSLGGVSFLRRSPDIAL